MVSHDLALMREMCQRVAWLDHGRLRAVGAPDDVVDQYESAVRLAGPQQQDEGDEGEGAVGGGEEQERVGRAPRRSGRPRRAATPPPWPRRRRSRGIRAAPSTSRRRPEVAEGEGDGEEPVELRVDHRLTASPAPMRRATLGGGHEQREAQREVVERGDEGERAQRRAAAFR